MTEVISLMTQLFNWLFNATNGVAGDIITFLTSNPICLIPLALYVIVALFGLVRRLIPSV